MLAAFLHQADELDHIACACLAVGRKATKGICVRIDLKARCLVVMKRATQHLVWVHLQPVVVEYLRDGELGFDLSYFHHSDFFSAQKMSRSSRRIVWRFGNSPL